MASIIMFFTLFALYVMQAELWVAVRSNYVTKRRFPEGASHRD